MLFPDLCIQLFDGSTCNGFDGWGPASKDSHPEEDHVDPELNEDVFDSHQAQDPPVSTQEVSASTQECSSRPQTQSKKRKLCPIGSCTRYL